MRLPKLAIDNHQFTIIIVILFLLIGLVSFFTMPRTEDPQIEPMGATIVVVYPGALPKDMEQLITDPIEDKLNEIDNIHKINSTITDGLSYTEAKFYPGGDNDETFAKIVRGLNSIRDELPEDIVEFDIRDWEMSNFVIVAQVALISDNIDYAAMDEELERLEKRLKKLTGVKKIEKRAVPAQEIRISIIPEKLAQYNIPLDLIIQVIQTNNYNIPGGSIDIGKKKFNLKTTGSYQSIDDIKNTILYSDNSNILYLKDIANIEYDFEDNEYKARVNGKQAVFLTIHQKDNTNIFDVLGLVKKNLKEFEKELSDNIRLELIFDQSESVSNRLDGFFINLLQGLLLVGFVIILAVGLKESLIVMLAIPISVLISIGFLDFSGYGLEQMSIAGLVIALGLLVDNAIVVSENISRFMKKGYAPIEAAILGTSQIGWPIISSTLTTVFAFIPIILIQDETGDYIRSMPLTVVFTLLSSLFIALTFTPYIAGKFLKINRTSRDTFIQDKIEKFVSGRYHQFLSWSVFNPKKVIFIAFICFVLSLSLTPFIGISFFPKAEKPIIIINIRTPEGSSFERTNDAALFVEKTLKDINEVKYCITNVGKGNPQIHYNVFSPEKNISVAQIIVLMKKYNSKKIEQIISQLREKFHDYPGAKIEVKEIEQGPPVEAPIAIKLLGNNMDILKELAKKAENIFQNTEGVINVNNPQSLSKTDILIKVDKIKAAILKTPYINIDRAVRACIAGSAITQYKDKNGKEFNIIVRFPFHDKMSIQDLERIHVLSEFGAQIPLSQLASIEFESSPKEISHYNFERSVTVSADVLPGYNIAKTTGIIVDKIKKIDFPLGYRYYIGGELETTQESFGGMGKAALIALIAIFAVLVLQFKSFSQPLIVFTAIPLAIIGSILALLITGNTFSFTAFIGLTSLLGIVINNSIILVDYSNQLIKKEGVSIKEAVIRAAEVRFTPIILTTLTTVGGLLPLTLSGGTMWAPMGWTIIGGLLISTLLTLIIVPLLYEVFTSK